MVWLIWAFLNLFIYLFIYFRYPHFLSLVVWTRDFCFDSLSPGYPTEKAKAPSEAAVAAFKQELSTSCFPVLHANGEAQCCQLGRASPLMCLLHGNGHYKWSSSVSVSVLMSLTLVHWSPAAAGDSSSVQTAFAEPAASWLYVTELCFMLCLFSRAQWRAAAPSMLISNTSMTTPSAH